MTLEDLDRDGLLPPYTEVVEELPMEPDLRVAYNKLANELQDAVQAALASGSRRLLGAYLQTLLVYPDRPWGIPPILDPLDLSTVATPQDLPKDMNRTKVARLVEIVRENKIRGRKVLVYATFTGRRDVQPWFQQVLEAAGFNAAQVRAGVDVLICNPKLVETGLDLLDFPSIVWMQTGYSLFSLRQASRRSWRIGQTQPVVVTFLAYQDTAQQSCLQLMGTKLEAAMSLEGRFSEDGLRALSQAEDMTLALAKAIVNGMDDVESAETVWRRISSRANPMQTIPVIEQPRAIQPVLSLLQCVDGPMQPQIVPVPMYSSKQRQAVDNKQQLAFLF